MSDENLFIVVIAVLLAISLAVLFVLNKSGKLTSDVIQRKNQPKEKTVIVSDAEKNAVLAAIPKKVVESLKDSALQNDMSTAQLQLSRAPRGTQEYEELKHLIESDAKLKKRGGVQKVKDSPNAPLRYIDKSTPRDRSVDALYFYIVDVGANLVPRFCVQTAGKRPLKPDGFTILADGREFIFKPLVFKTEKAGEAVAHFYDVPLDYNILTALQALVKSRKAAITFSGAAVSQSRVLSDDEKNGVVRMMETYQLLGGNFNYLQQQKMNGSKN
jgi:hypothetical protein